MRSRGAREKIARSRLFVISGPSGAGKGTIVQNILSARVARAAPALHLAVSYTTRSPRPTEREGV
ncbi:MAG: hypothetical protein ACRD1T_14325, partial [Acidimicrobiia bacterium]